MRDKNVLIMIGSYEIANETAEQKKRDSTIEMSNTSTKDSAVSSVESPLTTYGVGDF